MVEVKEINLIEAEKILREHPARQAGRWQVVFEQVKETGKPVDIVGLTTGQVAGIARAVKKTNLRARCFYKEGRVIVLPPEQKPKK